MWKGIVLASAVCTWRHLSRLQRCLIPFRATRSVSNQSLFTRTCLRHQRSPIFFRPIFSSEAVGCTAAVNAVEPLLQSSRHRYYHHGHRHSHSHTGSTTGSTFGTIPLLGVGLLLCRNSSQDDGLKFTRAAREGDIQAMKRLLKSGVDINCRHPLGWTALHTAVVNANWPIVEFLVDNGVDINSKDEFSSAPRMAAQERASSTRVAMARDRDFSDGMNHNASYSGFTPLHYAVVMDDESLVRYLLEHGADPTIENNRGLTPDRYCNNERVMALLEEYTAKAEERKIQEKLEERRKFPLEEQLSKNIVGQEGPITSAAAAIRRREMGWADEEHPLVFLFLGSSGIGKTELAKQIANYIHKNKKEGFIRLDMSEYQEKHEVAKLIGAPPGYVGYDQGGQLTSRLRECPNAVVLFDEVDKAHPDVLTALLQLFDEGRLTDGQGKTISCKDAIFVMTSNLANEEIAAHALQLRKEARKAAKKYRKSEKDAEERIEISRDFKEQVVEPILKRQFKRDEFLGRINEILYFLPFSRTELHRLVERELELWRERASKRHNIKLFWSTEVLDVLADGYSVKYGARSIHHEVERKVVNLLAAAYEQGSIARGSQVELVVEQDREEGRPVIRLRDAGKSVAVDVSAVSSRPQLMPF